MILALLVFPTGTEELLTEAINLGVFFYLYIILFLYPKLPKFFKLLVTIATISMQFSIFFLRLPFDVFCNKQHCI